MWSAILKLLTLASGLLDSFKTKPEPEEIPEPVDTKDAKDLLNPKDP